MEIKDIEKLAELAKIELSQDEKEHLLSDMEGILNYVKQIQEVDLPVQAGVSELEVEYKNRNVWREDVLEDREFSGDLIKEQFPDSQDGFVKVKKIM
ncbi:MAG: Asp-tRNA(Asn)/Glu-tRNA(Gln) amidotransferase subunit GatC [bacterium]